MSAQTISATDSMVGEYWQWQGHNIYYVKAGESQPQRPPLLLVHGFGASTDHWRKNISGLCDEFEVWAIDLLGFGRSAKPKLEYSGNLWRDQLNDFIAEVIGKKTVLAGNSLGGYACLCVAAQCPDVAAGLVLFNSAGPFSDNQLASDTESTRKSKPATNLFGNFLRWTFRQKLSQFLLFQYIRQPWVIRNTLKKVYADHSAITDQLVADIRRPSQDKGAFDVFCSVFSTPQGEKNDALLKQLICPLLILWGEADPWMNTRERSQKFRQYYPELTEHFLTAGHCPHDEVPEQVNPIVKDWVLSISHSPL